MLETLKFKARVQGVEIEEEPKKGEPKKEELDMRFKDPKEYEHLSKKEKKDLTEKMKGYHRQHVKLG